MQNSSIGIIERHSHNNGIDNFQAATDEFKLMIYKLTLQEIFDSLGIDLQMLARKYLEDLKEGLRETINGVYILRTRPIVNYIDIIEIMPRLMEANANLLTATTMLEDGKHKDFHYYMAVQTCRDRIFETLERLPNL